MKLYIWEGNGIGHGQGDNGVLVVLAESVDKARLLAQTSHEEHERLHREGAERYKEVVLSLGVPLRPDGSFMASPLIHAPEARAAYDEWYRSREGRRSTHWTGGVPGALDREPDRIVDLDTPRVVAFHEGGITE